jgi:hypothetical protein
VDTRDRRTYPAKAFYTECFGAIQGALATT